MNRRYLIPLLGLGLGWFAATALSWAIAARTGLALSATIGAGTTFNSFAGSF